MKKPGIGRKVALTEPETLVHRLTLRMNEDDFQRLCDLRTVLRLDGDGQTVRALIRLHHAEMVRQFGGAPAARKALDRLRKSFTTLDGVKP